MIFQVADSSYHLKCVLVSELYCTALTFIN